MIKYDAPCSMSQMHQDWIKNIKYIEIDLEHWATDVKLQLFDPSSCAPAEY